MSAAQVMYNQLTCDGCGVVYEHIGKPVAHVRGLAATDGWKHEKRLYGASNWARCIDLCPKREAPCSP